MWRARCIEVWCIRAVVTLRIEGVGVRLSVARGG